MVKEHTGMEAHDGYAPHSHEVRPDHLGVMRSRESRKMMSEDSFTLDELKQASDELFGAHSSVTRIVEQVKKNRAYENRTPVWKVTVPVTKLVTTSRGEQGAVSILKTELGMRGYTTGEGTATR